MNLQFRELTTCDTPSLGWGVGVGIPKKHYLVLVEVIVRRAWRRGPFRVGASISQSVSRPQRSDFFSLGGTIMGVYKSRCAAQQCNHTNNAPCNHSCISIIIHLIICLVIDLVVGQFSGGRGGHARWKRTSHDDDVRNVGQDRGQGDEPNITDTAM